MGKYGNFYGYKGKIDEIALQRPEFEQGEVYLDYTGSGLYQKRQLRKVIQDLESHLYGNSHSINPSSLRTDMEVEKARKMILKFFNVSSCDYSVIFTAGATGGLKIVGETFPWTKDSEFVYMRANHNSVLGIREYALQKGAVYTCTDLEELEEQAAMIKNERSKTTEPIIKDQNEPKHLFAFPATCNFSGKKYPLDLIHMFHNHSLGEQKGKYYVLLDAAAYVPTAPLDLSKYPADFVPISFYKIFGFPSGIGCLLVRNEAAEALTKTFFSGGTVVTSTVDLHYHKWRPRISDRFEDGTLPFLSILSLKYGFQMLEELGMESIKKHTFSLMDYAYSQMEAMRHSNGKEMFRFYGNHEAHDPDLQSPIINFNCLDTEGEYFDYFKISELASDSHIHLRSGCSCNPGACYGYLSVPSDVVQTAADKKQTCGDEMAFIEGKIVGSLRISFGYMTTFEEVHEFLMFIKSTIMDRKSSSL